MKKFLSFSLIFLLFVLFGCVDNSSNQQLQQPLSSSQIPNQEISPQQKTKEINQQSNPEQNKVFSMQEVQKHNNKEDCFIVIDKKVYNMTEFIAKNTHPQIIVEFCGKDGTQIFYNRPNLGPHPKNAFSTLQTYYIGDLQ
ncbi:MAG: cytochrome b5 domain-containing protein [Candidatus Anstonellaceae archaeon]